MIIIPKRRWDYPVAYERSYCKIMRAYVMRIEEALKDSLDDMAAVLDKNGPKMDRYESDLDALLTKIGARIDKKAAETALRRKVEQMYTGVNDFNEEEFKAVIRDAVGAEDFFINEKWQKVARSVWVQENISLIKSIRSQTLEKIRYSLGDMVTEAADKQTRAAQLSEAIQDIAHKNRTRADLIARDQIGKLNGRLTQLRQQSAGITKYKWSTSKDERVRPAHAEREGRVYEWANPPADGNPGYPIRCRCVAVPVIDTDTLGVAQQKGDRKIAITDIAIEKVPKIHLKGIDEEANKDIRRCAQDVLRIAKEQNDSNEVMILYNVVTKKRSEGFLGNENKVNFSSSQKFFKQAYDNEIALIHNHPSGASFSYTDLGEFLSNKNIGIMVVVTNTGRIRILKKDIEFSYTNAEKLILDIKNKLGISGNVVGAYQIAVMEEFLDRSDEAGVYYGRL